MKIYIVRHGQTDWNKEHRAQGLSDVDLNEYGIKEAMKRKELVDQLDIQIVISSPLKRAYKTAQIITKKEIIIDDRLKERSWGIYEGTQLAKNTSLNAWDLYNEIDQGNIEQLKPFMNRISSFIEDIKVKYDGQNVLIVAHSAVVRVFHYLLSNIPDDGDLSKFRIPNLEILEYDI